MAETFGVDFSYSKDKNLKQTLNSLLKYLIKFYYNDSHVSIQMSSAYLTANLYKYCSSSLTEPEKWTTIYQPIIGIFFW